MFINEPVYVWRFKMKWEIILNSKNIVPFAILYRFFCRSVYGTLLLYCFDFAFERQ